jgi:hypothetical protein
VCRSRLDAAVSSNSDTRDVWVLSKAVQHTAPTDAQYNGQDDATGKKCLPSASV